MGVTAIDMDTETRNIMVVDDHRTFTELLRLGIDARPGLACVDWATTVPEALARLEQADVDVVVVDFRIGEQDGVEATRMITRRWPQMTVVMLTAYPTRELMRRVADAGASALLPKDGGLADLLEVLESAEPGVFVVPPALLRLLMTEPDAPSQCPLTARELEVIGQLARGHDVRQISRDLGMAVSTTRGHVKAILLKLDAHSQLEAVARAWERGLLDLHAPGSLA